MLVQKIFNRFELGYLIFLIRSLMLPIRELNIGRIFFKALKPLVHFFGMDDRHDRVFFAAYN